MNRKKVFAILKELKEVEVYGYVDGIDEDDFWEFIKYEWNIESKKEITESGWKKLADRLEEVRDDEVQIYGLKKKCDPYILSTKKRIDALFNKIKGEDTLDPAYPWTLDEIELLNRSPYELEFYLKFDRWPHKEDIALVNIDIRMKNVKAIKSVISNFPEWREHNKIDQSDQCSDSPDPIQIQ